MRLHHVNIVTSDVKGLNEFYQTILGLESITDEIQVKPMDGYAGGGDANPSGVSMLRAGGDGGSYTSADEVAQLHLVTRDPYLHTRYNQSENPVLDGHVAFRCDDIELVKTRLVEAGIPFADYGTWAIPGWYQIFVRDPAGTLVEIHEAGYDKR